VQDSLTALATLPPTERITIFPGIPVYQGTSSVAPIGVSGDGVDQETSSATRAQGVPPPDAIRSDRFTYDGVRLPYVKFPRNPEL